VIREVLAEVEDVLNRPEIRTVFLDLNDELVGAFLKRLQKLSMLVRPVPKELNYPATKMMRLTSTWRSRRVLNLSLAVIKSCWI
jgi:hypothetical protein